MSVLKRIIMCTIIGILIITTLLALYLFVPLVIVPTKSSGEKLTLTRLGLPSPESISIKHYIDDKHVCTYVLELKRGLYNQTTQRYELPQIKEGSIEVDVEINDYPNNVILTNKYSNAYEVYKNGLLVYINSEDVYDDEHDRPSDNEMVCFISGNNKYLYSKKAYTSEWVHEKEIPPLKNFEKQDEVAYVPSWNYDWKTNKWIKNMP